MLLFWIEKIKYLLLVKAIDTFPDMQIQVPNYHDTWLSIINGVGWFVDLQALALLVHIFISYQLFRLAMAFYRLKK